MTAIRHREAEVPPHGAAPSEGSGSAVVARPIELEQTQTPVSTGSEEATLCEPPVALGATILGKYVIHGVLGRGAAAVVYEAEHLGLGRRVAFKVHPRDTSSPPELLARFRREARILASVRHPNVLEVYDTGELEDGSPFLVVECVSGETLAARLAQGPLSIGEAVSFTKQLLSALQALAERGIAHRDLKPDNLMVEALSRAGERAVEAQSDTLALKVVDFGVAKWLGPHALGDEAGRLTAPGGLVGTPLYMAPEQIRAEEADTRSDLYAVGAVLYEMLCGRPPHDGETFDELAKSTLYGSIPRIREVRPDCPEALERIVMCALSRDRHARYRAPSSMLAELTELELGSPSEAPVVIPGLPMGPGRRAYWGLAVAAVSALIWWGASAWSGEQSAPSFRANPQGLVQAGVFAAVKSERESAMPASAAPQVQELAQPFFARTPEGALRPGPQVLQLPRSSAPAVVELAREPVTPSAHEERRARRKEERERLRTLQAATTQPEASVAGTRVEASPRARERSPVGKASAEWHKVMDAALRAQLAGQLQAAWQLYQRATSLEPTQPAGFRALGLVAARAHRTVEARAALARYLVLAPDAHDADEIARRIAALH